MLVLSNDCFQLLRGRFGPEVRSGEDGVLQGGAAFALAPARLQTLHRLTQNKLRVAHVLVEILNHRLDANSVMAWMPAVVISHQRQRRITNLGLTRELRFL